MSNVSPKVRISLFDILKIIGRKKGLILSVTLAVFLLGLAWMYLTPNYYTSRASILPAENPELFRGYRHFVWMGMMATPYGEYTSMHYPKMIRSNLITDDLIDRSYEITDDGSEKSITLADYFGTDNPDEIRNELKHVLNVEIDQYGTGITFLVAETRYPELSRDIISQVLSSLDQFNRTKRITQTSQNLERIEQELADNRAKLASAENRLETFLAKNLDYYESKDPELLMTVKRLEREIEILEKTNENLISQQSNNRLMAAGELATLKILDRPTAAKLKSYPRRIKSALILAVAAFLVMSFIVFAINSFSEWSGVSAGRFFRGITDESKLPEQILQ